MACSRFHGRALAISLGLFCSLGCSRSAEPTEAMNLEQHDFILNCTGCHRLDGTGSATVPSLHGMKELGASDEVRAYFIRVPGVSQAPLSDGRLAAMMNWVVERFTGDPPVPRYTASEVAELRREPFLDPLAARAALTTPGGAQSAAIPKETR